MLKIIVTKQNCDGSFDDVGMNNRALFSQYKTVKNAIKYAAKRFANNKAFRVEVFPGGMTEVCNWVLYFDAQGNRIY